MDVHEFIRESVKESNRRGSDLSFADAAHYGLRRVDPLLYQLLTIHYTNATVTDKAVRDWLLENWSTRDDESEPERT